MRTIDLTFLKEEEFKDIDLYRYQLSPRVFDPDAKYFQEIYGFANMTSTYKSPIYICKPNFLGVSDYWREQLIGMNPNPDLHDTFISLEPLTGAAMVAEKRLQLNIYLPNTTTMFKRYNQNTTIGLFYPIFWGSENAEITDDLSRKFRDNIYHALFVKNVVVLSLVSAGSIFAAVGGALLVAVAVATFMNVKYYKYETVR
eukprot:TRINITY_DN7964_c0_g1_i1.p1 TRINITY_DN7964_c0_g1~~TRINITY_DN7964_c0_g1_i1.p1  ORF type:complete len:200 (+),score=45.26 TRINITY_DN7964_c0_g1_i1:77-676(+)